MDIMDGIIIGFLLGLGSMFLILGWVMVGHEIVVKSEKGRGE